MEQKRESGQALVARLRAEQTGKPYVADPSSPSSVLQASIWTERQAEYRQSINDFEARMRSDESVIQRNRQDVANYQQRLALAAQEEQAHLQLQQQGFGSKLRLLNATDNRVEMQRMLSQSQNAVVQAQQDLSALSAQRAVYIGKWRDDVTTQLVTAQNALSGVTQSLAKANKTSDLSKLVAPADSVVLRLGKASVGSVIDPGSASADPLFTLTPLGGPLVAELHVSARDIGFIRRGDPIRVKLDAYRYTMHGTAKGVIKTISDGSFTTNDDGQIVEPYYKVRVAITDDHLRNVPAGFRLVPGLTIVGEAMVGRRTIMSYLLEGGLRTGSEAMREPS